MTRTIGEKKKKKIGVISEPDIITKKIDNNSKFLVVGSDGLWEVIRPYDIIRMVRDYFNKGDIEGDCKDFIYKWYKLMNDYYYQSSFSISSILFKKSILFFTRQLLGVPINTIIIVISSLSSIVLFQF